MARSHGLHSRPNTLTQTKLSSFVFRLQLCGGPYIPISRLIRMWPAKGRLRRGLPCCVAYRRESSVVGSKGSEPVPLARILAV